MIKMNVFNKINDSLITTLTKLKLRERTGNIYEEEERLVEKALQGSWNSERRRTHE